MDYTYEEFLKEMDEFFATQKAGAVMRIKNAKKHRVLRDKEGNIRLIETPFGDIKVKQGQ